MKDLKCGPVDSWSIWRKSSNVDKKGVVMKSFESAALMKNESDAIEAAIRMLKSEFSILKRCLSRKARATLIPWLQEVGADNSLKFNRVFVK